MSKKISELLSSSTDLLNKNESKKHIQKNDDFVLVTTMFIDKINFNKIIKIYNQNSNIGNVNIGNVIKGGGLDTLNNNLTDNLSILNRMIYFEKYL